MDDKKTAVFGIYSSLDQAERGVDALSQDRFSNNDISVLAPDRQGTKDFAHEKHTKAPEGATAGAAAGGALGGTVGLLVGVGALAIPGLVPFIAAGPIMANIGGGHSLRITRGHGHAADPHEFAPNCLRREHEVDEALGDRTVRHLRPPRRVVLREGDPAGILDRTDAERAICRGPRQDHADGSVLPFVGK
jgi:hypothetical protein